MSTERMQMEALFHAATETKDASVSPGLVLYQQQIHYRRLTVPSTVFLHRLQNIWGPECIWSLLDAFFTAVPMRGHRWDRILAGLPAFIAQHEDYQRVLGLWDMTVLALKIWNHIHGSPGEAAHFPEDPIDLHALWQASAAKQEGDPQVFWESLLRTGPRGCAFAKVSELESVVHPFILASPSKIL